MFIKPKFNYEKGFTLLELLVVVGILGILVAIVVPSIINLRNEGREEAIATEHYNVQLAVLSMMVDAKVHELDNAYTDIDELEEIISVTATNDETTYSLIDYLTSGQLPLMQDYDITKDGEISSNS